jgi:mono/diheme cytochrome c family protein
MTRWSVAALAALAVSGGVLAGAGQQPGTAEPKGAQGPVQRALPDADPVRGRALFVAKGCIACHAINELGGTSAPPLDADELAEASEPFELVARMWRGAEAMIFMQQQSLGEQLDFTGQELADIIAFVRDPAEQRRLAEADVPPQYRWRLRSEPTTEGN